MLSTLVFIRAWVAKPLVVNDPDAHGEACYVLAGGDSIWERLDAGADLIQMGRVSSLLIMRDNSQGKFSFKAQTSWTRTQSMLDYLSWRGIPASKVTLLPQIDGLFGTLTEARNVARLLPQDVKTLVIVSSAPHMRRAVLAFRRSLPANVKVIPYAATTYENSYEMYWPIWVEYLKLLVYCIVVW
ncbi:MAG: YdcF family protein [Pseudomonadota bacterium]